VAYRYRPEILDTLIAHGLQPTPTTDPAFVRQALSDLYRHEIRRLRARLLGHEFPKSEYAGLVETLRRRYVLLKLPVSLWTVDE
jgi:hypothetical protein